MLNIIILALLWGPSFVFIKLLAYDLPIITLVALRVSIAAAMLLITLRLMKIKLLSSPRIWAHATVQGFFSCSLPFTLFGFCMIYIPSILGGCINGTIPMLTALLAHFFIADEKLNKVKVIGILLGLCGFMTLLLPTILDGSIDADTYSIVICLSGSMCYAIGMIYARIFLKNLPRYTGPCMQLTTASLYMIPAMLLIDPPLHLSAINLDTIANMFGLSILGTALAFIMYFKIVEQSGATYLSMVAYLLPFTAAMFGVIFLNESISVNFAIAISFIMLGLYCVNRKPKPQG